MKYLGFTYGWIVESFCILPTIDVTWMTLTEGIFWDLRFCWFRWYMTFGQIHNALKKNGY